MTDGSSKTLAITDNISTQVNSVAINSDGRLVAAASGDKVGIWGTRTGKLLETLRGHKNHVRSVVFTPDGRGLVSGSYDKTLKYWDVSRLANAGASKGVVGKGVSIRESNGACTMDLIGHKNYALSASISHDGQWVVGGSSDGTVQIWDAKSGIVQLMLKGHKDEVWSVDFSPTENLLATGSKDHRVRIWDCATVF